MATRRIRFVPSPRVYSGQLTCRHCSPSDSFYVFKPFATPRPPIQVPVAAFEQLNIVGALNTTFSLDSKDNKEPLVELSAPKSPIRIVFESNRAF